MKKHPDSCLICYAPLRTGGVGRPAKYCSEACGREIEFAMRRARRRLDKLEAEISIYERIIDTGDIMTPVRHPDLGQTSVIKALANAKAAIAREVKRIRLLAAEEPANA